MAIIVVAPGKHYSESACRCKNTMIDTATDNQPRVHHLKSISVVGGFLDGLDRPGQAGG
jgi:hypothetical protein